MKNAKRSLHFWDEYRKSCCYPIDSSRGGCFFFQAEDGIRDDLVTGVQTCALPIFGKTIAVSEDFFAFVERVDRLVDHGQQDAIDDEGGKVLGHRDGLAELADELLGGKIGRASCRERV